MSYNSQKHWTKEEKDFVFDNLGKMNYEEMSKKIEKSVMAIQIFLHRNRTNPRTVLKNNIVLKILQERFEYPQYFMPTREFYKAVQIGQRRWWLLYKGIEKATDEECQRITDYLKVNNEELFKNRQFEIF